MPKAIDTLELESRVGADPDSRWESIDKTRAVSSTRSSFQPIGFVFFRFLLRQGLGKPGLPSNS